eukprot:Gb_06246 [translate_table: standard]
MPDRGNRTNSLNQILQSQMAVATLFHQEVLNRFSPLHICPTHQQ